MRRMLVLGLAMSGAGAALIACGSSSDSLCEFSGTCLSASPGDGGADGDATVGPDSPIGDDGGSDGSDDAPPDTAPPGCDPSVDPKDSPLCVTDQYGIFVSPKGNDNSGAGTKASPLQTITTALTKIDVNHPRIYVCSTAGDFKEQVSVTADRVGIYGGWDCGQPSWPYTGAGGKATMTKLDPAKGIALKIAGTPNGVTVEDFQIEGNADVAVPGDSAIAVFASNAKATFKRVALIAHDGVPGQAGLDGTSIGANWTGATKNGQNGDATNGGNPVDCTCTDLTTSHGGAGGGKNGGGLPGFSSPDAGLGVPGGFSGTCSGGQIGPNGSVGAQAAGATTNGSLDANGWKSSTAIGLAGGNGKPASGGGGGGGDGAGGGGGGGCGGCGGTGGKPGSTGGSSFALLCYQSNVSVTVSVLQSTLRAGNAAVGGRGGDGQVGQAGGGGGSGRCGGGLGGNGPGGAGGGGGAGGLSTAIAYKGTEPTLDGPTMAALTPGVKGDAGSGGSGGPGGFQNLGDTQAATGPTGLAGADGNSQGKLLIP